MLYLSAIFSTHIIGNNYCFSCNSSLLPAVRKTVGLSCLSLLFPSLDCKTTDIGAEYSGTMSVTASGSSCYPWAQLSAHAANLQDPNRFPDTGLLFALNRCRNPDRKPNGPWCFVNDSSDSWEYCDIKKCTGENRAEDFTKCTGDN